MTEKTLLEAYLCGMRIGYRMSCLEDARMLRQEAEKELSELQQQGTAKMQPQVNPQTLERLRAKGLIK